MVAFLHPLSILLAAIVMSLTLAHALEYPGKRRLDRDTYLKVQTIYYPGFTIGGISEPLAAVAAFGLLLFLPMATPPFWLAAIAFTGLMLVQAIYWAITHPVNKAWLAYLELRGAGATFFAAGPSSRREHDWTVLRDRWEGSHIARAALAVISLIALILAA